jgi:hypothetical protein
MEYYSNLESFPTAGAADTAQRVGYRPSQGYVTKIESFSITPNRLAPGNTVQLNGSYYVMAPGGATEVKVTETRIVSYKDPESNEWKELGAIPQEVTSQLGTRRAQGSFDLPADVPEGNYRVTLKVAANGVEDKATRDLLITRN